MEQLGKQPAGESFATFARNPVGDVVCLEGCLKISRFSRVAR